ncbi:MAG: AMP-binding protein [Leptospiraceae bacterium]|nr:AMP-binding protein [Leptospiraceae bacterium]
MEKDSLYYLVRDTVATYAERPCYWVKPDNQSFAAVTYFSWRADMKRFQAYLLYDLEVAHGEKIGLLCDNRYEWNLLSLGIGSIGAVDVPRGCDATEQDIEFILNHTECPVLIVEHEKMLRTILKLLPKLPSLKHIISIDPPEKHKKLEEHAKALQSAGIKHHFLVDMLDRGDELLQKHGEALLRRRGEAIAPGDLATIIYTSGTTGTPKGVMLEHRSFCWEVSQMQQVLPMSEVDRVVIFLPPWHIAERLLEVTLIACGASMANSSIIALAGDLAAVKPTALVSVPRVWEQLHKRVMDNVRKQPEKRQRLFHFAANVAQTRMDIVDTLADRFAETEEITPRERMIRKLIALALLIPFGALNIVAQIILKKVKSIFGGSLRFAISGAGALPEHVAVFFRAIGIPILDGYGMTETTGVAAIGRLPWPRRACVGEPLPGAQVQLRDDQGKPITTPGVKGVAWHKGPHVMRGYYKNQEKTDEIMKDRWLNSGDIFVWTTAGEIKFAGRAKDTIVLAGGENVEPGPIEIRLGASEFISQVMVVGQDRKTLGALIVPNRDRVKEELGASMDIPEDLADWNKHTDLHKFFAGIVKDAVSSQNGFKAFEKVTTFAFLPKELEKGKEMTETMKIKRNVVLDQYESLIGHMYDHHGL